MQAQIATGKSLEEVFTPYIEQLPKNVYISIDIDGLEPLNCPNTGTPVPGGLRYGELEHLIFMVVKSGRKIIGFDLVDDMISAIQEDTVRLLYHVQVEQKVEREQVAKISGTNKDESAQNAPKRRAAAKVYPNDPCPCGSGKKYKQCCGRVK
jgi:hypothetical protein